MFGCVCGGSNTLTAIPSDLCGENIGQVQKLMFQLRQPTASPTVADIADASLLATWTALKALTTSEKVIVTPYVEEFVIARGTFITEGGDDNTTLNGNALIVGSGQIPVTGIFRSITAAVLRAIKKLNCYGVTALSFAMINEDGNIIGQSTGDATTDFRFIPLISLGIADPGVEGLNTHDKTPFQYSLRYGWRDRLKIVKPTDFDALIDL